MPPRARELPPLWRHAGPSPAPVGRSERATPFPHLLPKVVLFGDFFQLPPIETKRYVADGKFQNGKDRFRAETRMQFVFETDAFRSAGFRLFVLARAMRQTDADLVRVLAGVQRGAWSPWALRTLAARRTGVAPPPPEGMRPTVVCGRRFQVDAANDAELRKLPAEGAVSYRARDAIHDRELKSTAERFFEGCAAPGELALRPGAQVLTVANSPDADVPNGSRGVVVALEPQSVRVRLVCGRVVSFARRAFECERREVIGGKTRVRRVATREQIPLALAYAISTHRSQGASLDLAVVSLDRAAAFAPGLGYVMLSRVRRLDCLYLAAFDPSAVHADPRVEAYYRSAGMEPPRFGRGDEDPRACDCGVAARCGVSGKPNSAGRAFFSCGAAGGATRCQYFEWVDGVTLEPPRPPAAPVAGKRKPADGA